MSQKEPSPLTHGEYVLLNDLCRKIKGSWKAALRVDLADGIDMALIHESGLYVFMIEDEPGMVYGSFRDATWMRFEKTRPDEPFESPVPKLNSGVEALQEMFPNFRILPFIVFTNEDADVRVTGWEGTDTVICKAADAMRFFRQACAEETGALTKNQIDMVFDKLNACSERMPKMPDQTEQAATFGEFVGELQTKLEETKEREAQKTEEKQRTNVRRLRWTTAIICTAALAVVILYAALYGSEGSRKVAEYEKKVQDEKNAAAEMEKQLNELQSKYRVDPDGARGTLKIYYDWGYNYIVLEDYEDGYYTIDENADPQVIIEYYD